MTIGDHSERTGLWVQVGEIVGSFSKIKSAIQDKFRVKLLLLRIERSPVRWLRHLVRMHPW